MPYVGKTPSLGNFQKCDSISVVNGQAAYTLQVGGANVSPQSENHMLVSLNGILQAPVDSFTVSGSTLTFASNLVTGDVIDFVMILGNVLDLGVPSDNTVSLAKLTATGTKDATTFLRGDNSFAVPGGGKVLQVVQATDSTVRTTTSTSFVTASNTLSVNIIPSSTSSKILIATSFSGSSNTTSQNAYYTIYRDATNLGNASNGIAKIGSGGGWINSHVSMIYLDSPSSTSSLTYQVYVKAETTTAYVGLGGLSSIIAFEIAG